MDLPSFSIRPVRLESEFESARRPFRAYGASLDIDLAYQGFATELATLPGRYAPPGGEILLAYDRGENAIGCVALRPLSEVGICEMKRLFVAPEERGLGVGKGLVEAILIVGRRIGYEEIRLDTLSTMEAALSLYRSFGFSEIPVYHDTPIACNVFMALRLCGVA